MDAMRRRGVLPIIAHDPYTAMAGLVAGGSLAAGGPAAVPPGSNAILLLIEPSHLRGKRALLMSCRRYASGLRVWVYQHKASVQLRPLDLRQLVPGPDMDGPTQPPPPPNAMPVAPPPPTPASSSVRSSPGLRLTHEAQATDSLMGTPIHDEAELQAAADAPDNPGAGESGPPGLLTDEELAMLLADDDDDR
ncbi:MAG: hypothetical protein AAGF47_10905 [Planctomycetota bacterium]